MRQSRYEFRIWDVVNQRHITDQNIDYLSHGKYQSVLMFMAESNIDEQKLVIEQSTGLEDRHYKLVFENDVVFDDSSQQLYVVRYLPAEGAYKLINQDTGQVAPLDFDRVNMCRLVGYVNRPEDIYIGGE